MLRIVFDKKAGPPVVMAGGSMDEIICELSAAVGGIYQYMKTADAEDAEFFKVACSLCFDANEGSAWGRKDKSVGMAFKSPQQKED